MNDPEAVKFVGQNDVGKEMYFLVHGMVEVLGEKDSMHDRFALLEEVSRP